MAVLVCSRSRVEFEGWFRQKVSHGDTLNTTRGWLEKDMTEIATNRDNEIPKKIEAGGLRLCKL